METLWLYILIYYLTTAVGVIFLPDEKAPEPLPLVFAGIYIGWIPVVFMVILYKNTRYLAEWQFGGVDVPDNWKTFLRNNP